MNILIISEFFPATPSGDFRGGVECRNFAVSRHLVKNHNVWVIASHESGKPRQQVLEGIKVFRVGWSRSYSRKAHVLPRLSFILAAVLTGLSLDVDVIEGSGFLGFLPTYIIASLNRKKKTLFFPDVIASYARDVGYIYYLVLRLVESFVMRLSWHGVICISDEVQRKIRSIGLNARVIKTIYCGIDRQMIVRIKVKKSKFPHICCVSRIVSYKRIGDLVNALSLVKKRYPNVHCSIVGEGEDLNHIKYLTSQLGLSSNITFHGFLAKHRDVIRIIKSSHLFCLPSTVEGFGIVSIEAMASGVPIILANTQISKEISRNSAIYFLPKHVNNLAQKMFLLLENAKLRNKYAGLGRKLATNYQWSELAKQTERFYENLCSD